MARSNDDIVRVVYGIENLGNMTWQKCKAIAASNNAKITVNYGRTPNVVQLTGGKVHRLEPE